jgi:hypothetical protein
MCTFLFEVGEPLRFTVHSRMAQRCFAISLTLIVDAKVSIQYQFAFLEKCSKIEIYGRVMNPLWSSVA